MKVNLHSYITEDQNCAIVILDEDEEGKYDFTGNYHELTDDDLVKDKNKVFETLGYYINTVNIPDVCNVMKKYIKDKLGFEDDVFKLYGRIIILNNYKNYTNATLLTNYV